MGIVLVASWPPGSLVPSCYHNDINLETHQLGRKAREPIELPLRISVLDGDVLSFDVAEIAQSQPNCLDVWTHEVDRQFLTDTLSAGLSSAAARRPKKEVVSRTAVRSEIRIVLFMFVASRAMVLFHAGL